jgi:sugar phosphate isomerase/epimerase
METTRREFMKTVGAGAAAVALGTPLAGAATKRQYDISLAAWSLHRTIGKKERDMLDMPAIAAQELGINAIELVNAMLPSWTKSMAEQKPDLDKLAKNAADNKVKILLIMVDREGSIGHPEAEKREEAVTRHAKWVDIAESFGCHSIRMNWAGAPRGTEKDPAAVKALIERSVAPFRKLCDYGDTKNINVIIENHGGPSSYPDAMEQLMAAVGHERFGTLPDFGNFPDDVDKYHAIDVLMKYAKAVSAKCNDFDAATGEEKTLDFERFIKLVVDKHGYHGYIGIEFGGGNMAEMDGIRACKKLLEKLRG